MNRAYSLLEIKEADDDARVITGTATTPTPDRMGDIVVPEGASFKLPLPLLWQHDSAQPIGHVVKAKVTKTGIDIVAEVAKDVTEEIERAWKLIKSGLVRGLSIGFRGIETEQIPNSWGVIFREWEWLELSAVTIPAQAEANITTVKSIIDAQARAATGNAAALNYPNPDDLANVAAQGKSVRVVRLAKPAGVSAEPFVIKRIIRDDDRKPRGADLRI